MYFCKGYDYGEKAYVSKGYSNSKKKMWVTMYLSETIILKISIKIQRMCGKKPILVPTATILFASATDRELWRGPKAEVRESRSSDFLRSLRNLKQ